MSINATSGHNLLYNLFQKKKVGEDVMKLVRKGLFLFPILISMLALNVPRVAAVEPTATIYPSEGTVDTDIFLQVRGFGIGEEWDVHYKLYLFWDSKPIMTGVDDGGNHFYDIYFNPPNEHPYSDLGNHTVYVELWRSHYGWSFIANFTLVFEIVEWGPCPEYIALNATYASLLADYSALLDDFLSLLADYDTLQSDYNDLQNDYNSLSTDYSDLLNSYNTLSTDYDSLSSNYDDLKSSYESLDFTYFDLLDIHSQLQSDYSDLQENYDVLSANFNNITALYNSFLSNYNNLQGDYNSLSSNYNTLKVDYNSLESSYNNLMSDLGFTRNLSYVFIITAIIFIGIAVYLALRKPQKMPTSISEI